MLLPELQLNEMLDSFEGFATGKRTGEQSADLFSSVMGNILNQVNADKGLAQGRALQVIRRRSSGPHTGPDPSSDPKAKCPNQEK